MKWLLLCLLFVSAAIGNQQIQDLNEGLYMAKGFAFWISAFRVDPQYFWNHDMHPLSLDKDSALVLQVTAPTTPIQNEVNVPSRVIDMTRDLAEGWELNSDEKRCHEQLWRTCRGSPNRDIWERFGVSEQSYRHYMQNNQFQDELYSDELVDRTMTPVNIIRNLLCGSKNGTSYYLRNCNFLESYQLPLYQGSNVKISTVQIKGCQQFYGCDASYSVCDEDSDEDCSQGGLKCCRCDEDTDACSWFQDKKGKLPPKKIGSRAIGWEILPSAVATEPLAHAIHFVNTSDSQRIQFKAIWKAAAPPKSAKVYYRGKYRELTCPTDNKKSCVYESDRKDDSYFPTPISQECHKYFVLFEDQAGTKYRLPKTGSYSTFMVSGCELLTFPAQQGDGILEDTEICDEGIEDNFCCSADGTPLQEGQPCGDEKDCCFELTCQAGVCTGTKKEDGTSCNCGPSCALNSFCDNGVCKGVATAENLREGSCTDESTPCITGRCRYNCVSYKLDENDKPLKDECEKADFYCVHDEFLDAGTICSDNEDSCYQPDRKCSATGVCEGTSAVPCDDGNFCTVGKCQQLSPHWPYIGCVYTSSNQECDDGDGCTVNDRCVNGVCGGEPIDCKKDESCTNCRNQCYLPTCISTGPETHRCVAIEKTEDTEGGLFCTHENPCIKEAECDGGICEGKERDDGEFCFLNENPCVKKAECRSGSCVGVLDVSKIGEPCTTSDEKCGINRVCEVVGLTARCAPSVEFRECTIDDPCMTAFCNSTTGACQYDPVTDGTSCPASSNPCLEEGICESGVCTYEIAANGLRPGCDDGDPCTIDECVDGFCANTPIDCPDQDICNRGVCVGGVCGFQPVDCSTFTEYHPTCSRAVCSVAAGGCVLEDINENVQCSQPPNINACSTSTCVSGLCKVQTKKADGTSCDDQNVCTIDDQCVNGVCKGTRVVDAQCAEEYVLLTDSYRTRDTFWI